jgi:hypothetical protein
MRKGVATLISGASLKRAFDPEPQAVSLAAFPFTSPATVPV